MAIKLKGNPVINDSKEWVGDFLSSTSGVDLGSDANKWRHLYLSGQVNANTIAISGNADVDNLSINNVTLIDSGRKMYNIDSINANSIDVSGNSDANQFRINNTVVIDSSRNLKANSLEIAGTTVLNSSRSLYNLTSIAANTIDVSGDSDANTFKINGSLIINSGRNAYFTSVNDPQAAYYNLQNNGASGGQLFLKGGSAPSIELQATSNGTPFIDFKDDGGDYDARIIKNENDLHIKAEDAVKVQLPFYGIKDMNDTGSAGETRCRIDQYGNAEFNDIKILSGNSITHGDGCSSTVYGTIRRCTASGNRSRLCACIEYSSDGDWHWMAIT